MIEWNTDTLSPSQYKIADYIQKNVHTVLFSTEQEIADTLGLSIASVSRFWRSVGYKSIKDFKAQMREQLNVTPAAKMKHIMDKAGSSPLPEQFFQSSISHLQETLSHYSPENFEKAASMIASGRRIYIQGPGPSSGLARLLGYRLSRFGLSVHLLERGGSELLEDLLHLGAEDVVFIFGFVRLLPEAKTIVEHAVEIGYSTILMTDRLISDFSNQCDITLFASRGEMWEFHSMIAPTFLIENLIVAVGMRNQEAHLHKLKELDKLRKKFADELPR